MISFSSFIALAQTSSTVLDRYGKNEQPCLVPDFSRIALSFSLFKLVLAMDLLQAVFIILRYVPCIPDLSSFIMKASHHKINIYV